jgi:hypothetical protein
MSMLSLMANYSIPQKLLGYGILPGSTVRVSQRLRGGGKTTRALPTKVVKALEGKTKAKQTGEKAPRKPTRPASKKRSCYGCGKLHPPSADGKMCPIPLEKKGICFVCSKKLEEHADKKFCSRKELKVDVSKLENTSAIEAVEILEKVKPPKFKDPVKDDLLKPVDVKREVLEPELSDDELVFLDDPDQVIIDEDGAYRISIPPPQPPTIPAEQVPNPKDVYLQMNIEAQFSEISIRTEKKIWVHEGKDFHNDFRTILGSAYLASSYFLMSCLISTLLLVEVVCLMPFLFTLLCFFMVDTVMEICSVFIVLFFVAFIYWAFRRMIRIVLKGTRWRPWIYLYTNTFPTRRDVEPLDFDEVFFLPDGTVLNLDKAEYHIIPDEEKETRNVHLEQKKFRKQKYLILTNPDVDRNLSAMRMGRVGLFFNLLDSLYPGLLPEVFIKQKNEYVSLSKPKLIPIVGEDKFWIDKRSKSMSMSTIERFQPFLANLKIIIGLDNTYLEKKVLVPMSLVSEALASPTFYVQSDSDETIDGKINLFVKNLHTINIPMEASLKDDLINSTILVIKYYIRHKRRDLKPFDLTKNIITAVL